MNRTLYIYECNYCGIKVHMTNISDKTKVICNCGRYMKAAGTTIRNIRELPAKPGDFAFKD